MTLGCKWPTGLPLASWDSSPCGLLLKLLVYQLFCYPYMKSFIFFFSRQLLDAVCELVFLFRSVGDGIALTVLSDCGEATSTVQRKVFKYLDTP